MQRLVCLFVAFLTLSTATKADPPSIVRIGNPIPIDSLLSFAKEQLGKPYRYGAKGPEQFDCSGFTGFVFGRFGQPLAASSREQFREGSEVVQDSLLPGDLVFFSGRSGGRTVGHVGIVTECASEGFRFIHAASSGVRIDAFPDGNYYSKRYLGARRMLDPQAGTITLPDPVIRATPIHMLTTSASLRKLYEPTLSDPTHPSKKQKRLNRRSQRELKRSLRMAEISPR